jgi:hypothetical protein
MRAVDCSDPSAHDQDMHFTADDDEGLMAQLQRHRDEYHMNLTDDQLRQTIAQSAYDE